MPKYDRKEFAEQCGRTTDWLRPYIARQHVVENKESRLIDIDLPVNAAFLKKWKGISASEGVRDLVKKPVPVPKEKPVSVKKSADPVKKQISKTPISAEPITAEPEELQHTTAEKKKKLPKLPPDPAVQIAGQKDKYELDTEKRVVEITKLRMDVAIMENKLQKLNGEALPTDLVKSIFALYGRNMVVNFHNASENWLMKISRMVGLSDAQIAEFRVELTKSANECVERAQSESKKSIDTILKEFTLKRGVGEHD